MDDRAAAAEPTRDELNALAGPTLVEFGARYCGHCLAAEPLIAEALADRPQLRHLKIEDGKGRPLGRSFRVLLWPTLIFFADGREVARLVRPKSTSAIRAKLAKLPHRDAPRPAVPEST